MAHDLERGDIVNLQFCGSSWSRYANNSFVGQVTAIQGSSFVEVYVKGGRTHWFEVHGDMLAEAVPTWPDHQLRPYQWDGALRAKFAKTGKKWI